MHTQPDDSGHDTGDEKKTREQLVAELQSLRRKIAEIEASETAHKKSTLMMQGARLYAESIVETVREPLVVLDKDLRVVSANRAFYKTFHTTEKETEGRLIYELGNHQWDIPELRTLLEEILPGNTHFNDFEVSSNFPVIGQKTMLLNARRIHTKGGGTELILLAIEDITGRKRLEKERNNILVRLRRMTGGIIEALVSIVEKRDPYTAGHERRVAELARAIATEMRLPGDKINGICMAGIIHDLGKIAVPAEILSKPGKLTDTEFSMIKAHCQAGYDILKNVEFPWPVAEIILQHHERMNGSGYPAGLSNGDIMAEARVLGVADVVEAMSTHRPYRPALGTEKALEEVTKNSGMLYDAGVVDACVRLFREKAFRFE